MTGVAHLRRLCHRLRAARLRWAGAAVARDARLAAGVRARPGMRDSRRGVITLGPECVCDEGVIFDAFGGRIEVGRNVFFGPYSIVYGHGGVAIGDDCLISMHCRILSSNHTVPPFGTHSPSSLWPLTRMHPCGRPRFRTVAPSNREAG